MTLSTAGYAAQKARLPCAPAGSHAASFAAGARASSCRVPANCRDLVGALTLCLSAPMLSRICHAQSSSLSSSEIYSIRLIACYRLDIKSQGAGNCRFGSATPWWPLQSWPCIMAGHANQNMCDALQDGIIDWRPDETEEQERVPCKFCNRTCCAMLLKAEGYVLPRALL
jgi:hypothetical protein